MGPGQPGNEAWLFQRGPWGAPHNRQQASNTPGFVILNCTTREKPSTLCGGRVGRRGFNDEGSAATVATQEDATTADSSLAGRLGIERGHVIQEFGYDDDVDQALRDAIESAAGESLVDEDYGDVTDGVIVWFRDGDDDLADLLMDVQSLLDDGRPVWLLTPKAGSAGAVEPRDMEEASSIAGLHATSTFVVGTGWWATQLVEKGRSK